jgi:hypothetical protein
MFDAQCNCLGSFADNDGDGICDYYDQCPDANDNLIGSPCNDGDECTLNDIYTTDCECIGNYIDADNDGYCAALDPNDTSPCVPDRYSRQCDHCQKKSFEDFESNTYAWMMESGMGEISNFFGYESNSSLYLNRGNTVFSSMISQSFGLAGADQIRCRFFFFADNLVNGDAIHLAYSLDGGKNYSRFNSLFFGSHFPNGSWHSHESILSAIGNTENILFRISLETSLGMKRVYFDQIAIDDCPKINDRERALDLNTHTVLQSNK